MNKNIFIDKNNNLVIPFGSDRKYHWWNKGKGQNLRKTLLSIKRIDLKRDYVPTKEGLRMGGNT